MRIRLVTPPKILIPTNPKNPHFFQRKSATKKTRLAMPTHVSTNAIVSTLRATGGGSGVDPGIKVTRALNTIIELRTIIRINQAVRHQCLCFASAIGALHRGTVAILRFAVLVPPPHSLQQGHTAPDVVIRQNFVK